MKHLSRFCACALIALVFLSALHYSDAPAHAQHTVATDANQRAVTASPDKRNLDVPADDPALSITVGDDPQGGKFVVLENSLIRVRYGYFNDGSAQTGIVNLVIKSVNEDQAGWYMDVTSFRELLSTATVTYNGADRKTVRLQWHDGLFNRDDVQDVTIYPNTPYIRIDYITYGVNFVDIGSPGGGTGSYTFYGNSCWLSCSNPRGYLLWDNDTHNPCYYNRYPPDWPNTWAESPNPDPADAGSLNYKGYFIGGIYNPSNNRGYGRVMPVVHTNIVKLLFSGSPRGLEWFDHLGEQHQPFTGYIFVVTGGSSEIITLGQQIADQAGPPSPTFTLTANVNPSGSGRVSRDPDKSSYDPGEVVTLTATASPGWTFTSWSGDLSGSVNPKQITMNSDKTVTATFRQNPPTTYTLTTDVVGNGTVTKDPNKPTYNSGEVVTLTATADIGWTFIGWSGDLSGSVNPSTLTMTSTRIVTATFVNRPPVLNPIGDQTIMSGSTLSFTVSASDPDGITPTLTIINRPSGATFPDPCNGTCQFTWMPTLADKGLHTVIFVASDGVLSDTETITITVQPRYLLFLPIIARDQPASSAGPRGLQATADPSMPLSDLALPSRRLSESQLSLGGTS